ncbi:aminodeoxychorismate/anthranilate synthase component II [Suttonella sp. R2A3]|uniref:anthranilate synthase component II n=1 Tax=Suttonella sp. R2A3 TaxID=2908648 RepID=UPI001F473B86|nr:aminodeoxychorismate/anthranilate synthase component II [Suttonella sp. R2A3]UJF25210.1 aminodeoxychorismate/anthranilate synthase component II [Suttonella sp. R2A3]
MKVLLIDNYDSFVFNLYQYIGELLEEQGGGEVLVRRNDALSLDDVASLAPDRIVISPGPGSPDDPAYFGICASVIREFAPTIPMLGVCLGMQGMVHVYGGQIVRDERPMHGKTSAIVHNGEGVFQGLPQGVEIMRYHSLCAARPLPDCLEITAVVGDGEQGFAAAARGNSSIMGLRHRDYPMQGVQFHPESFATEGAKVMLGHFLTQNR